MLLLAIDGDLFLGHSLIMIHIFWSVHNLLLGRQISKFVSAVWYIRPAKRG